jgi:DeoR family transcriptional regulator, aga operon transcriptional repressor
MRSIGVILKQNYCFGRFRIEILITKHCISKLLCLLLCFISYKVSNYLIMETSYSTKERRAEILQELNKQPEVSVNQLSAMFRVSEVTIRKDLNELKRRNLLTRVRGGALRLPETNLGADLAIKEKQLFHYREKRAIGKLAASLINENETIILDSGTTTFEIAKNLHNFKHLTIVTNAINIAVELSSYNRFTVILLGGHLRESSLSTVGPLAESTLKIFYCDKLFLGVDSFNLEKGVSTPNIEEANINQTMMSMSKETIAVFDSSKFNKRSFTFIAPVDKMNTVVTDEGIPMDIRIQLKKMHINLQIARLG